MTSFVFERSWSVCITRVSDHRNSFPQALDSDTRRSQWKLESSAPRRPTASPRQGYDIPQVLERFKRLPGSVISNGRKAFVSQTVSFDIFGVGLLLCEPMLSLVE